MITKSIANKSDDVNAQVMVELTEFVKQWSLDNLGLFIPNAIL